MEQGIKFNAKKGSTGYKLMTAKFDGRCVYNCGKALLAGTQIVYSTHERTVQHASCCPFLSDLQAAP